MGMTQGPTNSTKVAVDTSLFVVSTKATRNCQCHPAPQKATFIEAKIVAHSEGTGMYQRSQQMKLETDFLGIGLTTFRFDLRGHN